MKILEHLVTAPAATALASIDAWWSAHTAASSGFTAPVERAMAGARAADRLGYAFASGYVEALRALVPSLPPEPAALCVTEAGGNHPAALRTALIADGGGWRLSGEKTFVTLGNRARRLLVAAVAGTDETGRARLAVVHLPADRAGVQIEPAPPVPFVPEIPHARVRLHEVRIEPDERLPGDGWDRYVKPFRTVEDVHVHAALIAWLIGVGRTAGWARDGIERGLALAACAISLAAADPGAPSTHLALAGLLAQTEGLVAGSDWSAVEPGTRARWERDRALLGVAGKARARRREVAWERAAAVRS